MAQSVKRPTLDFSSDHDLTVMGWSPELGSVLILQSLLGILFLSLLLSLSLSLSLSKINKLKKKKRMCRISGPILDAQNKNMHFLMFIYF